MTLHLPRLRPVPGTLAGSALCVLTLGACRADSVTMPEASADPICYTGTCAEPGPPAPDSPIVILPIEDVAGRIVPTIVDARARSEASAVIGGLRSELLAGRLDAARVQLAYAHHWVAGAGTSLNDAERSAIRLSLVPAAAALGVQAR